jgi:uncharacterized glyoxalase superfamily protein PhnB
LPFLVGREDHKGNGFGTDGPKLWNTQLPIAEDLEKQSLYLYVDDADATYQRALKAAAVSLEEPTDMTYGDRRGMVQDPLGNIWQIATYRGAP